MADWRTGTARALARWRAGDEAGAVTMLVGSMRAAGGHREVFGALVESADPEALTAAERLMIAVAHRHGDARMRTDLEAMFTANQRVERLAELRGLALEAARRFEAEAHAAAGRWVEARAAWAALVALAPADAEARYRLGAAERRLGDLSSAEARFTEAIALDQHHASAHADLGLIAWRRGDDATALPHLEAAHRAMPAQLRLAGLLAEALAEAGRSEEAESVLAASLRAGAPWTASRLAPIAAELMANPLTYDALFAAVAEVSPEAASACAERRRNRRPLARPALASPWDELLALPEPKRASLCMIVRDEAAHLGRLLDSAAGMAFELIIVDTGSTDDTVAIAKSYGARVFHADWTGDFAAARNESLKHATGDWVLRLDADQVVDAASRRGFRRFLQRDTHVDGRPVGFLAQLREHFGDDGPRSVGRTLAVFARDPAVRYEGALHEQVVDTAGRGLHMLPLNDMVIHHTGYGGDNTARHARNLGILRRELERSPDDAALHHGLGQELRGIGDHAGAIAHLERARALAPLSSGLHAAATILLADSHLLGRDWDAAWAVADGAIRDGLRNADIFGMRGHASLMRGELPAALADVDVALAHRGAVGAGLLVRGYESWFALLLRAVARQRAGEAEASRRDAEAAHAAAPSEIAFIQAAMTLATGLEGERQRALALLRALGFEVKQAP